MAQRGLRSGWGNGRCLYPPAMQICLECTVRCGPSSVGRHKVIVSDWLSWLDARWLWFSADELCTMGCINSRAHTVLLRLAHAYTSGPPHFSSNDVHAVFMTCRPVKSRPVNATRNSVFQRRRVGGRPRGLTCCVRNRRNANGDGSYSLMLSTLAGQCVLKQCSE